MTINNYNFSDKQALMKHLALIYQRQHTVLRYKSGFILKENSKEYQIAFHFIDFIDSTLELLLKEHKDILVNDFFYQKERNWWNKYYSKTTYYRIKATAMNDFLRCL